MPSNPIVKKRVISSVVLTTGLTCLLLCAPAPAGAARSLARVAIANAACVPVAACGADSRHVSARGRLKLSGRGLSTGMVVSFPSYRGGRPDRRGLLTRLHHSPLGEIVSVPARAHSGRIAVLLRGGHTSNLYGPIYVVHHALHPPHVVPRPTLPNDAGAASGSAFDGNGMWIWYVNRSDAGDVNAIIQRARAAAITTLYVKSSDGPSNYWTQFSPTLVGQLKAAGLRVCAWQYVYGSGPQGEAALGARAAQAGADCLVIDAEAEYEGRYAAAQTYMLALRRTLGPNYPIGLASFPYVDYHPGLPFSVFLGPGGAQYNLPQMYWKAIGTSVDNVFAHTYIHNRIYGRPLFPLGQTYQSPSASELVRFRALASAYGSSGVSWWDWQETSDAGWATLAAPLAPPSGFNGPQAGAPLLHSGSRGDEVLWLQEHLASAIPGQLTTGIFGAETDANLRAFQTSHGLPVSGASDGATWQALLALPPVAVDWSGAGPGAAAARSRSTGPRRAGAPASAGLPAVADEIPRVGAGASAR